MDGCNWPIESGIKSKRIKWISPPDQITWAWYKELRENNKTKKIYDIDPYVEVYQFLNNVYGLFTENADGMGDVWMYLIVGPEKAMLIDTSYGIGDLKGLVDQITGGKPLYVVNTHGHYDHAYGDCRFDRVYCHKYEVPRISSQDEHIWDYLFDENGNNIWLEFDKKDLPVFKKFEVIGCEDGHIFNLGGDYEIEMIWLPGHAPGHATYLDKKNRVLFTGDGACYDRIGLGVDDGPNPKQPYFPEVCNVKSYRPQLAKIVERLGEFDYVYPQHGIVRLEKCILPNILKACDEILANPDSYDRMLCWTNSVGVQISYRMKCIDGYGAVGFNKNK
jgi:glyoxylase-like metal-dependent hydrolase (beta-lactamase superfamily II)